MPRFISSIEMNPQVEIDRSGFPFTLPAYKDFYGLRLHPQATFFVGDNGSGKSTMIEALAVKLGLSAEGGTKDHTFSTFDSHSDFHESIVYGRSDYPSEVIFLRAESFYNLATYTEESAGGGRPRMGLAHQRSHGEGFLDFIRSFKPPGLYLFDEPESALSLQGQLQFLAHMKYLLDLDSQVIIATHSPIILALGYGIIYEFTDAGIEERTYHETNNYKLVLDFLLHRERYADILGLPPIETD